MPPSSRLNFLVVDHNADSRLLLTKTLQRKFAGATIHECETIEAAVPLLLSKKVDAVVSHRVIGYDGATTIRMLRRTNATVPIVMISGVDRQREANEAGATTF